MEPGAPDGAASGGAATVNAGAAGPSKGSVSEGASTTNGEGPPETPDAVLVDRAKGGDQAAFRELFDRYHQRLFSVALSVVKHRQDAMDVVQDAFVKVHRHLDRFEGSSSFYTWLYRIGMNLAIDHVRKKKRRRSLEYDDGIAHDEDATASEAHLPTRGDANPGRNTLRRELGDAIQAALDTLPEYHRAVIVLRELEGLTYEEMAEVLEVPKGTIMSRLFHARRKMQAALEGYLAGDAPPDDPEVTS